MRSYSSAEERNIGEGFFYLWLHYCVADGLGLGIRFLGAMKLIFHTGDRACVCVRVTIEDCGPRLRDSSLSQLPNPLQPG